MALDEWREVVDTYEAMEEEKKAESIKAQKKFAKANRMRDDLCKRRGNKRAIDSPVGTTSSGGIDSDDDGDEVTESEARTNLRNPSPAFAEEAPASDIPNSPVNQQSTTRKRKSRRFVSTHNRITKKPKPNKTDTMAEMSELRGLASALVKDTLGRRKEKSQRELTPSIAGTKELSARVLQVEVAIEEMHERSECMQETLCQILNAVKELS